MQSGENCFIGGGGAALANGAFHDLYNAILPKDVSYLKKYEVIADGPIGVGAF